MSPQHIQKSHILTQTGSDAAFSTSIFIFPTTFENGALPFRTERILMFDSPVLETFRIQYGTGKQDAGSPAAPLPYLTMKVRLTSDTSHLSSPHVRIYEIRQIFRGLFPRTLRYQEPSSEYAISQQATLPPFHTFRQETSHIRALIPNVLLKVPGASRCRSRFV